MYSFSIFSPERNLILRCENKSEMEKWIRILQMQIDLLNGGDGTHTSSVKSANSNKHKSSLEEEINKTIKDLDNIK